MNRMTASDFEMSPQHIAMVNHLQIIAWVLLAWWLLPGNSHFLYDEAYFFHQAHCTGRLEKFPRLGPYISGSSPTAFTPGGGLYLLLAVPFLFLDDPRYGTAWIILLSALAIAICDRILCLCQAPPELRLSLVTLSTWSYWHFCFSDRIWNVNLFWFCSLLLLAITHYGLARPCRCSWRWGIAFGICAALALQIHLGGALALACCLVLIGEHGRHLLSWRQLASATAGFIAMYLPYLLGEIQSDFRNSRCLLHTLPANPVKFKQILRALLGLSCFSGNFDPLRQEYFCWIEPYLAIAGLGVGVMLVVLGFFYSHPWRRVTPLLLLLVPLYFYGNGRAYFHHYLAAIVPYCLLTPAAGAALLLSHPGWKRRMGLALLLIFAISGASTAYCKYRLAQNIPTVARRIARVQNLLAAGKPLPGARGGTTAFINWVIARNIFGRELTYLVGPERLVGRIKLEENSHSDNATTIRIDLGSYFQCAPEYFPTSKFAPLTSVRQCTVKAGAIMTLPVVITNPSKQRVYLNCFAIHASYRIYHQDRSLCRITSLRTPVVKLLPCQRQELRLKIQAPGQPGTYLLELSMVHEGVIWWADVGFRGSQVWLTVH